MGTSIFLFQHEGNFPSSNCEVLHDVALVQLTSDHAVKTRAFSKEQDHTEQGSRALVGQNSATKAESKGVSNDVQT